MKVEDVLQKTQIALAECFVESRELSTRYWESTALAKTRVQELTERLEAAEKHLDTTAYQLREALAERAQLMTEIGKLREENRLHLNDHRNGHE
jgi:hypothetical protein